MDRRNFFSNGIKGIVGEALRTPLGNLLDRQLHSLSNLLAPEWLDNRILDNSGENTSRENLDPEAPLKGKKIFPRPPGALQSAAKFNKACTRCNDCIIACPHSILFNLSPISGPVFDPEIFPCHLCEDWPCIEACETGALQPLGSDTYPKFGEAVLIEDNCLNTPENRINRGAAKKRESYCKSCVTSCPVEAVVLNKEKLPAFEEYCTGCGLCVRACPVDPRAIKIIV